MKRIIYRFPVISAIAITVLFLALSRIVGEIWIFGQGAISLFGYEAVHIIIPFLLVLLFGDVRVYTKGGTLKTFVAGGYMALSQLFLFLMMLAMAFSDDQTKWRTPVGIAYGIVMLFGIGFREESIFRGIIVNNVARKYAKDRKGIFITAVFSGILFGFIHLTNILVGVDIFSVIIQSVAAMGIGFYLAAVYLRGGSLWALIIMHSLADAASLFFSTFTLDNGNAIDAMNSMSLINLTPFFIFTLLGTFLLRKEKCDEIIERYKNG